MQALLLGAAVFSLSTLCGFLPMAQPAGPGANYTEEALIERISIRSISTRPSPRGVQADGDVHDPRDWASKALKIARGLHESQRPNSLPETGNIARTPEDASR
jgi:hypothetical protein